MFFDLEVTDTLLTIPPIPPPITRQYAFLDLLSLNNKSNSYELINRELNLDEYIFRSTPNCYLNNNNKLPHIKKYNSEINELIKIPKLKRNNTF